MHVLVPVGVLLITAAAAWYPIPFCVRVAFGDRCSVRWAVPVGGHERVLFASTFGRRQGARFLCQLVIGTASEAIPTSVTLCRSVLSCALDARLSSRTGVGTGDAALTAVSTGLGWVGAGIIAACCPGVSWEDMHVHGDFSRVGVSTVVEFTGRARIGGVLIKHITS